jgi:hypothetical protein
MPRVRHGYVVRPIKAPKHGRRLYENYRDWYLVKSSASGNNGIIAMNNITLGKEMIGKRVRIKIEEV